MTFERRGSSARKAPSASRSGPRSTEPPPTRATLHEAALWYLARGAASAKSVSATLERRIAAWMRRASRAGRDDETVGHEAAQARELIEPVIERLREVGLLNDQAFAATRATRLSTGGRSRRAIRAHLNDKGIDAATVRTVTTSDTTSDFHAAIAFAKRRRIGPFARQNDETLTRDARRSAENKALGAMARAGFDFDICTRVLRLSFEDASALLQERRGPF